MEETVESTELWQDAWLKSYENPLLFVTGVLGILPYGADNPNDDYQLEKWQEDFLKPENFFADPFGIPTRNPRHSVRSGHGIGKGAMLSWLALWFVLTRYDAKAVITANSQDQLRDNNWPELKKWSRCLPDALREQIQIDGERMYLSAAPEMSFLVRRTASKGNPEALQGLRAKHTMYLVDEASGIENIVFEVAMGAMSADGAIAVLTSNPTRPSGFFYDTHHTLAHRWRTYKVSSTEVPRARGHIQDMIASYGKDSNKYGIRVLGEFPVNADDVVIPLQWIDEAIVREVEILNYIPVWGLDVGRFGDDSSALAKRQANRLLEPVKEKRGRDVMQVTGWLHREYIDTHEDMRPKEILVDVIGIGAGVVDRCRELGLPARGINVGETIAVDERFMRLRDELWWAGREWFESKDCTMPNDPALKGELATVTYDFHSNGKIVVETKKEMKARGMKSPNCADAFLLTFAGMSQRKMPLRNVFRMRAHKNSWAG
jgi:phage terminase large subunit